MSDKKSIVVFSVITMFIFMTCSSFTADKSEIDIISVSVSDDIVEEPVNDILQKVIDEPPKQQETPVVNVNLYSDEEVDVIARTLAGECYDHKLNDKRKVAEVIVNRVTHGGFGDSVVNVVSAKGQFNGYWKQSRPISETDIQIAEETLNDWYANNCTALSNYLYFSAGPNKENIFRSKF